MSTLDILRILFLNILIEDRTIVTTIGLRREVEAISGVLWECSHETLNRLPKTWSSVDGGVRGIREVGVTVGCASVACVIGTLEGWEADNQTTMNCQ